MHVFLNLMWQKENEKTCNLNVASSPPVPAHTGWLRAQHVVPGLGPFCMLCHQRRVAYWSGERRNQQSNVFNCLCHTGIWLLDAWGSHVHIRCNALLDAAGVDNGLSQREGTTRCSRTYRATPFSIPHDQGWKRYGYFPTVFETESV
jgi:hypothetical protein